MSEQPLVGVLGATSLVGRYLLPLLVRRGHRVLAVSRSPTKRSAVAEPDIAWSAPGRPRATGDEAAVAWITLAPLWTVPDLLPWLDACGARRLVALSSTSVATRASSPTAAERRLAARLAAAEQELAGWADGRRVRLTIFRPTMIYDGIHDANVVSIAACVRRFGWFPLCGPAAGLRQPVHAGDVAAACLAGIDAAAAGGCYTLSGGEVLPFRELVERTCRAHGLPPRTVSLPAWCWNAAAAIARGLGVAPGAAAGVGHRMNEDLSCGHAAAAADLGFAPRPFVPGGSSMAAADIVNPRPDRQQDVR